MFKKIFKNWNLIEIILLFGGFVATSVVSICFKSSILTFSCSVVAILCALLTAKGKAAGNLFGIVLVVLYSIVSFKNRLYGEVVLYIVVMLPLYIISLLQWLKNRRKENNVVIASDISDKEWAILLSSQPLMFAAVYYFLEAIDTSMLLFSTLSFVSLSYTIYLTAKRSQYSFIYYFVNDIVLTLLWGWFAIKGDTSVIPIVVSPFLSCIYDIYGVINWKKFNSNIIKISDFEYKQLHKKDMKQIKKLIKIANQELSDGKYIDYTSEEETQLFNSNYSMVYGIFCKNELIGKSELFLDQQRVQEVKQILGLEKYKVCQISRVLDKPEYRHKDILHKLLVLQVETAKNMSFNYITAFVHPDDTICKRAIKQSGFEFVKTAKLKNGLDREFYLIKV